MKKDTKQKPAPVDIVDSDAAQPPVVSNPPPKPELGATNSSDAVETKKRGRKPRKEITAQAINRNAGAMVDGTITAATAVLGEHWNADKEERDKLAESVANYYHAKGEVPDLSPGLVLAFAVASYTLPRIVKTMQDPPVKSKALTAYNWIMNIKARRDAKNKNAADKKAAAAKVESNVKHGGN